MTTQKEQLKELIENLIEEYINDYESLMWEMSGSIARDSALKANELYNLERKMIKLINSI